MTVDIIIPNYNGSDLLEKNIPSVLKSLKNYASKLIIVDDASSFSEKQKLREVVQKNKNSNTEILLLENLKNLGFASTVNKGVDNSVANFVVLLNSDVIPKENFLESPLGKLKEDADLFAVGCMDESMESDKKVLRGRGIGFWKKGFLQHKRGEIENSDTFWVSGGSGIFRREIYEKLGGMDEIYAPFYWEDIDLSYRACKSGYKILFDKGSIVEHIHQKGAIKKYFTSEKITTISYRNQFIFVWKDITNINLLLNHCLFLPVHIIGAVKSGNTAFLKGFFLALFKLPAIITKRRRQKKLYKISDLAIINRIS
jgi:GT2 family glycosyltransferase